jgi:hypothetical protein
MEWYEIIGGVLWFVGLYLRGKFYEWRKGYKHNDSWKSKKKVS